MPAAAVIQGGQALFILNRRKGYVGGFFSLFLKSIFKVFIKRLDTAKLEL